MSEFYHTYNRGVEKRKIFLDDKDYLRGVHDLYEFNDKNAVINFKQRFGKSSEVQIVGDPISNYLSNHERPKEKLIDLLVWSFMPNHYHLFSTPIMEKGLSKFHQKFGIGFSSFFNTKYQRSGVLFQGKHKKVHVDNDAQVLQLICYVHANPLDIWKPDWKEKGLTSSEVQGALEFLEKEYRWSSHRDYLGIKNFPSLISTDFVSSFFNGPNGYREFFTDWLRQYEKNKEFIQKLILE